MALRTRFIAALASAAFLFPAYGGSLSIDAISNHLQNELKLDGTKISQSKASQTLYFWTNEECALINCYKYKVGARILNDSLYVSTLSSMKVVPFVQRLEVNEFGRRSVNKFYFKLADAMKKYSDSLVVLFDSDKTDSPPDFFGPKWSGVKGFGANAEAIRMPVGAPKFRYYSFDYLFKNGMDPVIQYDTIPMGGVAIIEDYYCGLDKSKRTFDVFLMLPDFKNREDVEPYSVKLVEGSRKPEGNSGSPCGNYYSYLLKVNDTMFPVSRIMIGGQTDKEKTNQLADWRLTMSPLDSIGIFQSASKLSSEK